MPDLQHLRLSLAGLQLYADVFDDECGRHFCALLETVSGLTPAESSAGVAPRAGAAQRVAALDAYRRFAQALLRSDAPALPGGLWRAHLIDRMLLSDNAFSRAAAAGDDVSAWAPHVGRELDVLQQLAERPPQALVAALEAAAGIPVFPWPDVALRPLGRARTPVLLETERTAHQLAEAPQWSACVQSLADHHRAAGPGRFARTFAFIWRDGELQPIDAPDPIRLDALTGYEAQRAAVVRNAEKFVLGLPANNALLYGDRGTGKSATVKALGWAFAPQGLRIVEVQKDDLDQLPDVLARLPGAPLRFVIFVDDLSFGEGDERYKHLKALLEGSLSVRPANVLMMVTSNRRHLLPERHADRIEGRFGTADDEVHAQDGIQEKLSLADRFGLNVVFSSPDQEMFLRIVTDLARRRGLALETDELHRRALQWTRRQRGRSARTAVQFVDDLHGELALAAAPPN